MPGGDGIAMTQRIMQEHPVPVVLITAHDPTNPNLVFRALQAGALEVLPKPPSRKDPDFEKYMHHFRRTLRILYGMPVVRRFHHLRVSAAETPMAFRTTPNPETIARTHDSTEPPVIAIGASTGGPTVVAALLQCLQPGRFRYVVVAQHIVADFLESFNEWLQSLVTLPVKMAESGEHPQDGVVYLTPPSMHLILDKAGCWKLLPAGSVVSPHVPSIDALFGSLTALNARKAAILLTGMGQDGAAGLRALKDAGAFTIVQDPASAVVPSMPQTALRINAASAILHPTKIEDWLRTL
jgi:two-component system chemotaxis response regulator CheB